MEIPFFCNRVEVVLVREIGFDPVQDGIDHFRLPAVAALHVFKLVHLDALYLNQNGFKQHFFDALEPEFLIFLLPENLLEDAENVVLFREAKVDDPLTIDVADVPRWEPVPSIRPDRPDVLEPLARRRFLLEVSVFDVGNELLRFVLQGLRVKLAVAHGNGFMEAVGVRPVRRDQEQVAGHQGNVRISVKVLAAAAENQHHLIKIMPVQADARPVLPKADF